MRIGPVTLSAPLILAPMAGITHMPFRVYAREAGCGLVCSEMISSNGLYYGSEESWNMLAMSGTERPLAVQLFGQHPEIMAWAAEHVQARGADIIDINFGCAVKKVLRSGSGAALMRDPKQARAIIRSVRESIRIPLTIKMRSGWEASGIQALEIACIAEDCGADAVTIHPRTARQGFSGQANWGLIKEIKQSLAIPVIGSGDIKRASDVPAMLDATGCDGAMIGRAAIGNPWIFTQALAALEKKPIARIPAAEHFALMRRYLAETAALFGEEKACRMLRSRLGWFSKKLPASTEFRRRLTAISHLREARSLLDAYEQNILSEGKMKGKESENTDLSDPRFLNS
ncbi:MAG: tRNA dihydrouridine synthase DusB [Desulfosalsimonadaceae bacterium]